jgi:hypothetical protein
MIVGGPGIAAVGRETGFAEGRSARDGAEGGMLRDRSARELLNQSASPSLINSRSLPAVARSFIVLHFVGGIKNSWRQIVLQAPSQRRATEATTNHNSSANSSTNCYDGKH